MKQIFQQLTERCPAIERHLADGVAVAIDGERRDSSDAIGGLEVREVLEPGADDAEPRPPLNFAMPKPARSPRVGAAPDRETAGNGYSAQAETQREAQS